MPLLQTKNLKKTYANGVQAVRGVDLEIKQGTCFGLLGPNGAGKSTTIEMMEGILQPTSGEILFRGKPVDRKFSQKIGIQFQNTALQDYLRVNEVLELFYSLYKKTRPMQEIIDVCDLGEYLYRDAKKLSGGQRQRVLLAIALINDPELIFLDEPTTGLDPQARRNFWDLIKKIKSEGKTVLLTTHYMDEAELLCDDLVIVDEGKVISHDTPEKLIDNLFEKYEIYIPPEDFPSGANQGEKPISTNDLSQTLNQLSQQGVSLRNMKIRQFNLEDVFIKLTGKSLRE